MKEIKLIALDLDGTLLNTSKQLSQRNSGVLQECVRRGILVVPCTGRIWGGVPPFIRSFPGIRYAITTNGAVVENVEAHQILDEQKMDWRLAVEILQMASGFRTMYDVYVDGQAFGEARFVEHMDAFQLPQTLQSMIRETRKIVPDVIEEVRSRRHSAEKINYFFGDMEERKRAKQALIKRGDVFVSSSFPFNLEINAPGATKGAALKRLTEILGLELSQTMSFGDGENDITMVKTAGIGVAMGNGIDSLKREADYVTASNDEDGVAAAIEKLVLNRGV